MPADPNPPAKNEPAPDVSLQPKEGEQETTPAQISGFRPASTSDVIALPE